MKDALATELLAVETGIKDPRVMSDVTRELQALATLKYDQYEGYRPGVKFMESLAIWLGCFDAQDRETALNFVRNRLVYLSRAEIDHLVEMIYPHLLRPTLLATQSQELFGHQWDVARTALSPEYHARERRMLVLGMSDGARLDKFRRSSPLSTEQFHQAHQIDTQRGQDMQKKLAEALKSQELPGPGTFQTVLVVDDFSASGRTMLRYDEKKSIWEGKLLRISDSLDELKAAGVLADDYNVVALIYLMTAAAKDYLQEQINLSGLSEKRFSLMVGHVLSLSFPLQSTSGDDAAFMDLCRKYYNADWEDENTRKGGKSIELGFAGSGTPLVLHHNTPNNSPPIIWKDEGADPAIDSPEWFGVFPRHERHHASRP